MERFGGGEVSGVYDAVVVGAGIVGSCIAYELAKRCSGSKSVLLLEQFEFLHHRGSSHGESRLIRVTYPEDYYTEMMLEAYRLWESAERDSGYAVYTNTGQLDFGPVDNSSLRAVLTSLAKFGIAHQILTPAQVMDRFPMLHIPEHWIAVYTEHGGVLHASKAVAMFQSLAAQYGATLRDRAKVLEMQPNSSVGGVSGVSIRTSRGTVLAKKCILAAGAWNKQLVQSLTGIELPLTALHTAHSYWAVEGSDWSSFSETSGFPIFITYDDPFIYGTPSMEYPGLIKTSNHAGTPCNPDTRSVVPDLSFLKATVSPWIAEIFKGTVKHDNPIVAEGCMYTMTPDEDFILDFLPDSPDILLAAGFSGHGFKMAPLIGRIMADLALTGSSAGGESGSWLHHFSLKRFEKDPRGNVKSHGKQVVPPTVYKGPGIEPFNSQIPNSKL